MYNRINLTKTTILLIFILFHTNSAIKAKSPNHNNIPPTREERANILLPYRNLIHFFRNMPSQQLRDFITTSNIPYQLKSRALYSILSHLYYQTFTYELPEILNAILPFFESTILPTLSTKQTASIYFLPKDLD